LYKKINSDNKEQNDLQEEKMNKTKKVTCRVVFLKLGQIDTKNERYDAEGISQMIHTFLKLILVNMNLNKCRLAYIEASWEDDAIFRALSDPNMSKCGKFHF
jgi:hypothetical protein